MAAATSAEAGKKHNAPYWKGFSKDLCSAMEELPFVTLLQISHCPYVQVLFLVFNGCLSALHQ